MSGSSPPKKGWLAHYGELIHAWRRKGPGDDEGQDALQDSALGLLESGVAAIQGNPRAYLAQGARNGMIDRHRRRTRFPSQSIDDVEEVDLPVADSPESACFTGELIDALMAALEELPVNCRQVYVHHRLEGWTQVEIAGRMGLSLSMVEKHMQRAMRHIAERLKAYAPH